MKELNQAARNGRVIGFRITSERAGDIKKFVPLVKEAVRKKGNVTKAYAAYDSKKNFNLLDWA
ncbi:MAG: hypothetical protein QW292_10200 [Candidatus Parvarchaeota archaeon]